MKAPGEPARGPHAQPDSSAQLGQLGLFEYRQGLVDAAREHGERGAAISDPDAFAQALEAIRNAADTYGEFTADDIVFAGRTNAVGAGFSALRKAGEIEVAGYAVSRRPAAHGRLVRVWRRS